MSDVRLRVRDLPQVLDDLGAGPYPEYVEDVLAITARTRRRPGWAYAERWLPDLARKSVGSMPGVGWRAISLVLLLLALLLAAVLVVGSRQRLPEPFGAARNGLIAMEVDGDIHTVDLGSGRRTPVVTGPEIDDGPRFLRDGTLIAFERRVGSLGQLFVVRPDGSGLRLLTPEPISFPPGDIAGTWRKYEFSADGRSLVVATIDHGLRSVALVATDGTGVRHLPLGMSATEPSFRPLGSEILFVGRRGSERGIHSYDVTTSTVRTLVVVPERFDLAGASWSPDGLRIAYWRWGSDPDGMNSEVHVVNADGSGDRVVPSPPGGVWSAHATWSNDGTRLFVAHGFTPRNEDVRGFVLPADLSHFGTELAQAGSVERACCAAWSWAPDDSKLLGRPSPLARSATNYVVIDVATGTAEPAPWRSTSDPTWQRIAP